MTNPLDSLSRVVKSLARRPLAGGNLTVQMLSSHGIARGQLRPDGYVGILAEGIEPFEKFSNAILNRYPQIERGTRYDTFQKELLSFLISRYLDKDEKRVRINDVSAIEEHISRWFQEKPRQHTVFVPCFLAPSRSNQFSIGPIEFLFIDDIPESKYYSAANTALGSNQIGFESVLHLMRSQRAHWLAVAEVETAIGTVRSRLGKLLQILQSQRCK